MKPVCLPIGLLLALVAADVRADILPPPSSTDGLVAYYTFTGNANDSSGHAHDGTAINATLTTDRFGNANNAYFFNGNDAIIDIPTSPAFDFNPANGLTISVWADFTQFVFSEHLVGRRSSSVSAFWQMATGIGAIDASHLPLNTWCHFVVTIGGSQQVYYVNGGVDTVTGSIIGPMTDPLDVFIGGSGDFQHFLGGLDEVRIYDRILSPSEVQELYQFEVPEPGSLALIGVGAGMFLLRRRHHS